MIRSVAEGSGTYNGSNQDNSAERLPTSKERAEYYLGKAIARRAVYGSSRGRGSRKVKTNDVRMLKSRLSRVSLADETEN
ncbi:unnamed protein product [Ilex paraguariensis]|uniref:Uncharacterized protein n=1 Tax=Ilex paraguariensis TaxID=185542 RepID=A0ABC8RR01_9AQUA